MKGIAKSNTKIIVGVLLPGIALLLAGLVFATAIENTGDRKTKAAAINTNQKAGAEKKASSGNTNATKPNTQVLMRAPFRPGDYSIPESNKLTLEQARKDTAIKLLVPKILPDGARLEVVYRIPGDGAAIKDEIVQRYYVDGNRVLTVGARSMEQAPDFKTLSEQGGVWVLEGNPDGDQKWVRKDNAKFVTVNGIPGKASEPTVVEGSRFGTDTIRNPGMIGWYANGTLYSVQGDMPVSELLKIAESME